MTKRTILWLGISSYSILLFFSVIFYQERIAFIDMAFHLFFLLKDQHFAIQNYRFGAVFTQAFPLVGDKFNLSLKSISLLYSISFITLYFGSFLIILQWVKDKSIAICYLLFCTLMVRDTFYWAQSELSQAAAFAFIYFAILHQALVKGNVSAGTKVLMFALLIVTGFTHPLMPFLLLFVYLYFALHYRSKWRFLMFQFAMFVLVALTKMIFFNTSYDNMAMGGLYRGARKLYHLQSIASNADFVRWMLKDYFLVLVMLLVNLYLYLKQRNWKKGLLMLSFFAGYALMANLSQSNGTDQFYMELRYLFLSAFVIFPFVFDVLPVLEKKWNAHLIVAPILSLSLIFIFLKHKVYTERIIWCKNLLSSTKNNDHKKLLLDERKLPIKTLMLYWGIPYEMWLLSSIESNEPRSVISVKDEHDVPKNLPGNKDMFFDKWSDYRYTTFPAPYFNFTDTNTNYVWYNDVH